MRKILLLIFYLCLFGKAITQPTFEYIFSSPISEISRSLIEDEDGNIYFSVENFQYGMILKINSQGELIDSITIHNSEGTCNLAELIRCDSGYFIALGNWTMDSTSQLWFVKFDSDLNVIENKFISSSGFLVFNFHFIINHNNNIVFVASVQGQTTFESISIYEITKDGTLIRNSFFDNWSFNQASTLLENYQDSTYKVFALAPLGDRNVCTINYLDSSFQIIDDYTGITNHIIDDQNSSKWINDSEYLLTGRRYLPSTDETDVGILKMNLTDSITLFAYFGKQDTIDYAGLYKNLDFIAKDNIFFAAESNIYGIFQNFPSWIMLNILDSNLNLKNQRYYGGDAFYLVNAILATQDSGCVLSCSRYDWLTQSNEFDIYILKVNKDGLLVSTTEYHIEETYPCTIYPNPGKDEISISSSVNNLQVQLFDLTGKTVFTAYLLKGSNTLSVHGLSPGLFVYRILDHQGLEVQAGKWMKVK